MKCDIADLQYYRKTHANSRTKRLFSHHSTPFPPTYSIFRYILEHKPILTCSNMGLFMSNNRSQPYQYLYKELSFTDDHLNSFASNPIPIIPQSTINKLCKIDAKIRCRFYELVHTLPKLHADIVQLLLEGASQQEIAYELNRTQGHISALIKKFIAKQLIELIENDEAIRKLIDKVRKIVDEYEDIGEVSMPFYNMASKFMPRKFQ